MKYLNIILIFFFFFSINLIAQDNFTVQRDFIRKKAQEGYYTIYTSEVFHLELHSTWDDQLMKNNKLFYTVPDIDTMILGLTFKKAINNLKKTYINNYLESIIRHNTDEIIVTYYFNYNANFFLIAQFAFPKKIKGNPISESTVLKNHGNSKKYDLILKLIDKSELLSRCKKLVDSQSIYDYFEVIQKNNSTLNFVYANLNK